MARAKKAVSRSATVGAKVRDYGNDPFFVKKTKESKAFLEKHGFPKDFVSTHSQKGRVKALTV